MIEGWKKINIGDIGNPKMCKRIMKSETSEKGEIPFYKISTFTGKADSYISKKIYKEYKRKYSYPKEGDILISASGTIGKTVVFNGKPAYFQDSNIVWIDNNEKMILNQYLKYVLAKIHWTLEGSTIKRLYNGILLAKEIIIPEKLEEQQVIVNYLSNLDNLIESIQNLMNKKEKIRLAYISEYLTGNKRKKGYSNKWYETQIKDVCTSISKGRGLSKEVLTDYGTYKCILYGEIFTTYHEIIQKVKSKTNSVNGVSSKKGDILIPGSTTTTGKDLAKSSVINEEGVLLGGDINILRVNEKILPEFLSYLFSNILQKEVEKVAQGTTIIHLYGTGIENIKIYIPEDTKEQKEIVDTLIDFDNEIFLLKEKLKKYEKIKEGMMEDLLTGKVRVKYE